MQRKEEVEWLLERIIPLKPKKILEIGCLNGGLTTILASTGARVVSVDAYDCEIGFDLIKNGQEEWGTNPHWWKRSEIGEIFPYPHIKFIHADSNELKTANLVFDDYDVVLIDGGHDLKTGQRDFDLYAPMARKLVAIHDINGYKNLHNVECFFWPTIFWYDVKMRGIFKTEEFAEDIWAGFGLLYPDDPLLNLTSRTPFVVYGPEYMTKEQKDVVANDCRNWLKKKGINRQVIVKTHDLGEITYYGLDDK